MLKFLMRPLNTVAIFLIGFAFVLSSCKKPEDEIGIDLQPDEDLLSAAAIDTFSVIAFTVDEDSVATDKWNPANLGAYVDPIFGFAKAGHVTEVRLSTSNPDFVPTGSTLTDIIIDSLVMILDYQRLGDFNIYNFSSNEDTITYVYGTPSAQFIQIFELDENLSVDDRYYDNRQPTFLPTDLVKPGFNLVTPAPFDSVTVNNVRRQSQIRLPMNDEMGYRIIEASAEGGLNAEAFLTLVKGFYFQVDEAQSGMGDGGIIYFDTFSSDSKMRMYYRNLEAGDTLEYDFPIRVNTGKYNLFDHDFSQAQQGTLVEQLGGNTALGQQDLYVQAMSGTKVRIEIPYLEDLRDLPNVSLNKAVLSVPVRVEDIGIFPIPERMFLFGRDEEGRLFLLQDELDSRIGGIFDKATMSYRFFITRYVQDVLSGSLDHHGFEMVASRAAFSGNRVVLNGPEYPDPLAPANNLKFSITFTQF